MRLVAVALLQLWTPFSEEDLGRGHWHSLVVVVHGTKANGDPGGSNESTSQLASGEDDGERRGSSKSASNLSTNRRKSRENLTVAIKTIRSPFSSVSAHFLDEIVPVPVTIEPRTESRFAIGCSRFASIVDTF